MPSPRHRLGVLVAVSAAVFLSRALFLPPTLEDIDSVNFARALAHFDPRLHQPHPPGYPVYIFLGKIAAFLIGDPARTLALLSALAQVALLAPLLVFFAAISSSPARAYVATGLVLTNPILWFNGARPMSDSVGFLFAVSAQALLLRGSESSRALTAGSLLAGLTPGVRLQAGLLTLPLWLYALVRSPGRRLRAMLALVVGMTAWIVPLLLASGGVAEYFRVFGHTLTQVFPVEPLVSDFTVNRAARAIVNVAVRPWASATLGLVMVGLAALGFLMAALRRPSALGIMLLAFAPYLVVHLLFQQVETLRYSLPYIPLLAWLAAEGIGFLGERLTGRPRRLIPWAAAGILAAWSTLLVLPALAAYHRSASPPYAAFRALDPLASPRDGFLLAGHFMFFRYFDLRPPGLDALEAMPGMAVAAVRDYWRSGGAKTVLFMAEPKATDLESIAPEARRVLRRWEWPPPAQSFLAGERPNDVELVRIDKPDWFLDTGWVSSLRIGETRLPPMPERRAYLKALAEPAFLLIAGEPIGPAAQFMLELRLAEKPLDRHDCGIPLLRGYLLTPAEASQRYVPLTALTKRQDVPAGAPFSMSGLDYGSQRESGFVHGDGWFVPEKDERLRPFRWASPKARSLLHVPARGSKVVIEGTAPLEYLGTDLPVEVMVDGARRGSAVLRKRDFRMEVTLEHGGKPFQELLLATGRSFVPELVQRNGDRRRLALRVYSFRLE